ncbi:site-2 protease family protein [Streptomyces sp. NPDC017940]|uniref:site-2 protease family protein n=1 Tax=Streptomyces sp. NPDC017940 TaxID=3365017 RepID=UPI0037873FD5
MDESGGSGRPQSENAPAQAENAPSSPSRPAAPHGPAGEPGPAPGPSRPAAAPPGEESGPGEPSSRPAAAPLGEEPGPGKPPSRPAAAPRDEEPGPGKPPTRPAASPLGEESGPGEPPSRPAAAPPGEESGPGKPPSRPAVGRRQAGEPGAPTDPGAPSVDPAPARHDEHGTSPDAPRPGGAPGADDTPGPAGEGARRADGGSGPGAGGEHPAPPRPGGPVSVRKEHPADGGADRSEASRTARTRRAQAHHTPGEPPKEGPKNPGGGLLMGRPFGVPVYVAPSWFLVAALITWVFGGQLDRVLPELGNARYLVSLFFAVAFYASVLVHELAHTVAALRFKLPVRRIQLQFFGGVSEIEKESETPGREFVLAFVGPLLSLVLAGVFYAGMQAVEPGTVPGVLLAGLMISNLIVAAFNLLPGLPLDGGRMLRAVVWKITGRPMSGTVAAAWVGRALAISVLVGLPILNQSGALGGETQDIGGMDTVTDALLAAILAAIIWTGAGNSLRMARLREHLPELRARALTRRAVPVETDTPLSEALRRANAAGARALVVVDPDGDPVSVVREAAIVGVPEHRRPWVTVSGLAQDITEGMRIPADVAGEDLLDRLRTTPASEYLVVEESGEIYGVLSAADVERAFVKAMARPS